MKAHLCPPTKVLRKTVVGSYKVTLRSTPWQVGVGYDDWETWYQAVVYKDGAPYRFSNAYPEADKALAVYDDWCVEQARRHAQEVLGI